MLGFCISSRSRQALCIRCVSRWLRCRGSASVSLPGLSRMCVRTWIRSVRRACAYVSKLFREFGQLEFCVTRLTIAAKEIKRTVGHVLGPPGRHGAEDAAVHDVVALQDLDPVRRDGFAVFFLDAVEAKQEVLGHASVLGRGQGEGGSLVQVARCWGDLGEELACCLVVAVVVGAAGDGLVDLDDGAAADADGGRDLDVGHGFTADLLGEREDVAVGQGHDRRLLEQLAARGQEAGPHVDGEGAEGELVDHDARLGREVEEGESAAAWSGGGGD